MTSSIDNHKVTTKEKIFKVVTYVIGILIISYLLYKVNINNIIEILSQINLFWLVVAVFILLLSKFLRGFLWQFYLKCVDIHLKLEKSIKIIFGGDFIGQILISNIGFFSRPLLLKAEEKTINSSHSLASVVIEKLNALFARVIVLFIGLIFFFFITPYEQLIIITIVLLIFVYLILLLLAVVMITRPALFNTKVLNFFENVLPSAIMIKIKKINHYLMNCRKGILTIITKRKKIVAGLCMQMFIHVVVMGLMFYTFLRAVNINFLSPLLFLLPSIASSLSIVPLTPLGMGFVEVFAIILFSHFGMSPSVIMSVYILIRTIDIIITTIFGGLIASDLGYKSLKGTLKH